MLRAIVTATAIGLAAPSYAQVKVITGDVEHVYGPGGEILDDRSLRQRISARDARRPVPDPLSNKGCQSSSAVQVKCQIVGGAMTPHGAKRPRAGGTITAISRPRARGAASESRLPARGALLAVIASY